MCSRFVQLIWVLIMKLEENPETAAWDFAFSTGAVITEL